MKCILMNKNMPVVELKLDDDTATILKVMKIYELDFLPIGIDAKTGIPNKKESFDSFYLLSASTFFVIYASTSS